MTGYDLNAPRPNLWAVARETDFSVFDDGTPNATFRCRKSAIRYAAYVCLFYQDGVFYRAVPIPNTRGLSPQFRAGGWRDIATAPKDGSSLLLSSANWVCIGRWKFGQWQDSDELHAIQSPTHWMPLPAAPTAMGEDV